MEDKILIQSEVHRSVKLFLKRAPIVLFGLAVFFVIFHTEKSLILCTLLSLIFRFTQEGGRGNPARGG